MTPQWLSLREAQRRSNPNVDPKTGISRLVSWLTGDEPRACGGSQRTCPSAQDRIDLWHGSLQHARWTELLHVLSDEERRRTNRFAYDRDARRFVVSHAVLRALLG